MKRETVQDVIKHTRENTSILTPERLKRVSYSVIVTSAKFNYALEMSEIKKTEEQKKYALDLIKKITENLKNGGHPVKIDPYFFAIGYPESYELVKPYYEALLTVCLTNPKFTGFTKENEFGIFRNNPGDINKKIAFMRDATFTLFVPIIAEKELKDVVNETGMSLETISKICEIYKRLKITSNKMEMNINLCEKFYQQLKEGATLDQLAKKHNCSIDFIHNILEANLNSDQKEEIQQILKNNSLRRYMQIKNTVDALFLYVPNGIVIGNKKMAFNMLDYFSISQINPKVIAEFIEDSKNINTSNHDMARRRAIVKKFLSNKSLGPTVSREKAIESKSTITSSYGTFEIKNFIDEILSIFNEYNIPHTQNLIYDAFARIARNQPVLPLIELKIEEEKTNGIQKH